MDAPEEDRLAGDLRDGGRRNPTDDPAQVPDTWVRRPEDLGLERTDSGLRRETLPGVEGPAWLPPDFNARGADEGQRSRILSAVAAVEEETPLFGVSAPFLAVATKP